MLGRPRLLGDVIYRAGVGLGVGVPCTGGVAYQTLSGSLLGISWALAPLSDERAVWPKLVERYVPLADQICIIAHHYAIQGYLGALHIGPRTNPLIVVIPGDVLVL